MRRAKATRILILAAGGSGQRFGRDKLLVSWQGLPLFTHCLKRLLPAVDHCIIVTGKEKKYQQILQRLVQTKKLSARQTAKITFAPNGASRQESVIHGLEAIPLEWLNHGTGGFVAVQDAARPLTSAKLLRQCFASAEQYGSGVAAHRVTDTIHVADDGQTVQKILDRTHLWAAETPQVFCLRELQKAYQFCQCKGLNVTDEATAMQRAGYEVRLVENHAPNPKVTHPADLKMLQVLVNQ